MIANSHRLRRLFAGAVSLAVLASTAVAFSPFGSSAGAAITVIPSNYFTVQDGTANDEPGQKDLTQMGRDDTSASRLLVFWSWDDTDFSGQAGDACALFSATSDGHVTFAICGEVVNGATPGTVVLNAGFPTGYTCTPTVHPLDRCDSGLAASIGTTTAGPISGGGTDLVTQTDPFNKPSGTNTTLALDIQRSALPSGVNLVNVCSYPSIANGANNDPSDCIVTPGGGFLQIVKNATGGDRTFDFTINPLAVARSVTTSGGTGTSAPYTAAAGTGFEVTESVPSNWDLDSASCLLQDGTTSTGTFHSATDKVDGITVEVGRLTTCTFADVKADPKLHLVKSTTTANFSAVGDTIDYTYTLTNTGNVPLTPPYSVSDDKTTVSCDQTPDPLPAGGVTEVKCTASYTVDQADLDAGSVTNEATAKAKYNGNDVPSNQAKLTVNAMRSPALGLDKDSTDKANGYSSVGDVLNYTYDLTNIGNVTLDAPTRSRTRSRTRPR